MRRVDIAERISLLERVMRIVVRLVGREGRHHQCGLGFATVLHQQASTFGVDADRLVVVEPAALECREVQEVVEVVGQLREVAFREITHHRVHSGLLTSLLRTWLTEAGDAPQVVVLGELLR